MYNYYGSDYGYCDPNYGCPDDFYDMPLYYGQVYWGDSWYPGPFYYRDFGGRRQFWVHGGWHDGNFRGGRFGPALGRGFYQSHNFAGRGFGGNARRRQPLFRRWRHLESRRQWHQCLSWYRQLESRRIRRQRESAELPKPAKLRQWRHRNGGGFGGNANRQSFQSQQSFGNGGVSAAVSRVAPCKPRPAAALRQPIGTMAAGVAARRTQAQAAPQRFNGGGGFRSNVQSGGGGGFHGQAQQNNGGGWHGGGGGHHH